MKKRILQFIPSFHQGGSERQAVDLTRMLKADSTYEVFAATLNAKGVLRSEFDEIGLAEIPEFRLTSFYNANFVMQVRQCAQYFRDNKIVLVHTYDFYTNVFGMAAARLARVPVRIASKRETGGVRSKAQDFLEKIAFGRADAVVVNSAAVGDHLRKRGIPAEKFEVIHNGLDLKRFAQSNGAGQLELGLPDGDGHRFVTMVANLRHRVKNVPMLLRVAKRVIKTHPDSQFVIAGEGELESELKQAANELGIANNVHFIGRCTDVPELLSISCAGVMTSNTEGFSNSILEYMAAGLPVVATNVGGAAEVIIDGETGYLVTPDDDEAMEDRLVSLLNDKKKAGQMGERGKAVVEREFSIGGQIAKTKSLYEKLLNNAK